MYIPDPCTLGYLSTGDEVTGPLLLSMYRLLTDVRLLCSFFACFSLAAQLLETPLPTMAKRPVFSSE
jgi:hypothetical protein